MDQTDRTKLETRPGKVQQGSKALYEQHLQEFKDNYMKLNDSEKKTLRQIVSNVATIQGQLRKLPASFCLRFCVSNNIVDPDSGEIVYHSYGQLGSNILLKALDIWEANIGLTIPNSGRRR